MNNKELEGLLFNCVDEYNRMVIKEKQLKKSLNERLFSRAGYTETSIMDSMGLVNFLVIVEAQIKLHINNDYYLNFETLFTNKEKYLQSINSLLSFLTKELRGL